MRIIRTARKMNIQTLAVFTEDDRFSLHVTEADEAVLLPGDDLQSTYLDGSLLVRLALEHHVEAIHPGYGFLSENADFAEAVEKAGLIFIGPTPEQIRLMGEKNWAFAHALSLDIPVLPSLRANYDELLEKASQIGFPLIVKASAGGGGKGMIVVHRPDELPSALEKAARQALNYFGNDELFLEKYCINALHIEVQVLGDGQGNMVHLFERECSVQRNFQKIIEEAPSVFVSDELRIHLTDAALKLARSVNYRGVGTVEFLVDGPQSFYFLEMNTRIQVEHPVTELVTGIDLVEQQLLVAAGNSLNICQTDISLSGHAVEVRVCAEEPENEFWPSTGTIDLVHVPLAENVRTDTFIQQGTLISSMYDSLLMKQIAFAETREKAILQLQQNLALTQIYGVHTNISFLIHLLGNSNFQQNNIHSGYLGKHMSQLVSECDSAEKNRAAMGYVFHHFYRRKEKPSSLWEKIDPCSVPLQLTIWVDGQLIELSAFSVRNRILFLIENRKYIVEFKLIDDERFLLQMDGLLFVVRVKEDSGQTHIFVGGKDFSVRSNSILSQVHISKQAQSEIVHFQFKIKSDLFGKVVFVGAKSGDFVRKGAVLLVLESMKTEFRILSPQDSLVNEILVEVGDQVKDGQQLVLLQEPVTEGKSKKQYSV